MQLKLFTFAAAIGAVNAALPSKSGYSLVWGDDFNGATGAVNGNNWTPYTPSGNANGEVQRYTSSTNNLRVNGNGGLNIIPVLDKSTNTWTSGRIHGKRDFTCAVGHKMVIEASIAMGTNPSSQKQGIWPAFWAMGSSWKSGTQWPLCGEWDIMEQINGQSTGHGTLHCDVAPGGRCNEYTGLTSMTSFSPSSYTTWSIQVDRTITDASRWREQSITWYKNGAAYKRITGATIGDLATWTRVARSPFFIILNVAVGGAFPGPPNSQTAGGAGSGMNVAYVGVWQSN